MTSEQLAAIARRWMAEVWQQGNVAAIDDLHASSFVDSSPAGLATGRDTRPVWPICTGPFPISAR
jgi:hypothetical protein